MIMVILQIADKNYNVEKAEKALRKVSFKKIKLIHSFVSWIIWHGFVVDTIQYIKWRADNNMDTILDEDMGDIHKNFVYYMDGVDKEGRPGMHLEF